MSTRKFRYKRLLCEAQNWRCAYCSIDMTLVPVKGDVDKKGRKQKRDATIEHFEARGNGGQRHRENEVAACRMCNEGRNSIDAMTYFEKVKEVGRRKAAAWGRREQAARDRARATSLAA